MIKTEQRPIDYFILELIVEKLHKETGQYIQRQLKANCGLGNDVEEHIQTCRHCQRKLTEIVTK